MWREHLQPAGKRPDIAWMRYPRFAVALLLVVGGCGGAGDDATADALTASEDALAEAAAAFAEAEAALTEQRGGGEGDEEEEAVGIHVGGYESASINRGNTWRAEVAVTVVDTEGNPVSAVDIEGAWDEGDVEPDACTTSDEGICTLKSDSIRKNITWSGLELTAVVHAELPFLEGDDYNLEGMEISIHKP